MLGKCRKHMNKLDAGDEEAWLAQRWELVTGSAAAALMGRSFFKTREELLDEYIKRESAFKPNRKAWFGNQLEVAIGRVAASALSKDLLLEFCPRNELRWEEGSSIGSTTDGYLTVKTWREPTPFPCPSGHKKNWAAFEKEALPLVASRNLWVEIKNVGQDQLKRWNTPGSPPDYYWTQCQTQLLVLDEPAMALVAMVGGQDIRGHIIRRDDKFLEELQKEATVFMQQVREGREL